MHLLSFAIGAAAGIAVGVLLWIPFRRKQQRKQAPEAMDAMAHRQRLETIGLLTSSISHEFNNLLTPIMGYSLMALEKLEPEGEIYDDILEVYTASGKAKELILRLSDLSRKNSSDFFRTLSPDDLVHKTITVASPAKPDNVEVKLSLNCLGQQIDANELQLNQLLLNLVVNGFQAMEQTGGTLMVRTWFDEKHITMEVSDTGCGIEKSAMAHIFDPFFTTKPTGKGTGLGLAIAAQVAEDHHGTITVASTPGKGTAFTVKLPRSGK